MTIKLIMQAQHMIAQLRTVGPSPHWLKPNGWSGE